MEEVDVQGGHQVPDGAVEEPVVSEIVPVMQ
jgi:hypothetical protein